MKDPAECNMKIFGSFEISTKSRNFPRQKILIESRPANIELIFCVYFNVECAISIHFESPENAISFQNI